MSLFDITGNCAMLALLSPMVSDLKKRFGLLELPAIMAGLLTLLIILWELVWRHAVSMEDEWAFLQDTRFMLFGLVASNLLLGVTQWILELIRKRRIARWVHLEFLTDAAALLVLSDNIWNYMDIPSRIRMDLGMALSTLVGLFALLHAKIWYDSRRTGAPIRRRAAWPPALLFLISLLALIFLGGLLLLSPGFTNVRLSVVDAFFLSTSAVTVTGLSPVEIDTVLTVPGKVVLLVLMQVGAFGVMTFTYFVALLVGMGLSVRERVTLSSLLDQTGVSSITSLIRTMVLLSFAVEALGTLNLYFAWQGLSAVPQDLLWWYALFHSVSAFCNCGLTLFPDSIATPGISGSMWGQGTFIFLMLCGSLGFAIYLEIIRRVRTRFGLDKGPLPVHWSTHAWLVMRMTLIMLLAGLLLGILGALEPSIACRENGFSFNLLEGIYNTIAARTSGFQLSEPANHGVVYQLFLCVLMFIGGNPGSTSGGVMTSVVALVFMEVLRILQGRRDVTMHGRSIIRSNVERAMATFVLAVAWVVLLTSVMLLVENHALQAGRFNVPAMFFEVVSSFATCGFSLRLTDQLSNAGKYIILLNMIVGRVGLFSFVLIWMGQRPLSAVRYPDTHLPLS